MRRLDQGGERHWRRPEGAGFTLVELLVVIAIIGLIISLVLVASADGIRRAEERATQGLITKLETGYNDRLDALLNIQGPINQTHRFLAAISFNDPQTGSNLPVDALQFTSGQGTSAGRRAQVIAQIDYIRSELPDVFFLNANTSGGASVAVDYPFNFAAVSYPTLSQGTYDSYLLPLGNTAPGLPYYNSQATAFDPNKPATFILTQNPPYQQNPNMPPGAYFPGHTGIFGASYSAMGGLTKSLATNQALVQSLGYSPNPQWYDGVDNNSNGYADEVAEGAPPGAKPADYLAAITPLITSQLSSHTHKTARAEMLYAILVNGVGPLGSVFNADDFTAREVQDTDGDGLPEFVDAWGEPLQFYRWPIYYGAVEAASDIQIGSSPYTDGFGQYREQNPLDTNQLLVSPGWWANSASSNSVGCNSGLPANTSNFPAQKFVAPNTSATLGVDPATISQSALAFMTYFGNLMDPYPFDSQGHSWDRTGVYGRRAYFSKVLILSGGPDKEPGVAVFGHDYNSAASDLSKPTPAPPFPDSTKSMAFASQQLILIENQASQSDPYQRNGYFYELPDSIANPTATTSFLMYNAGLDDITSHNVSAPTSGVR